MNSRVTETRHALSLGGRPIQYLLRRSDRKTIGLRVDHDGLRVSAPRRASQRCIETLLGEHADWVNKRLEDWQQRPVLTPLKIIDGQEIPWLGGKLLIRLDPDRRRGYHLDATTNTLTLSSSADASARLRRALQQEAGLALPPILERQAARMGVGSTPNFRLSSAKTRWGSCSSRGVIALNWRLCLLPVYLIEYVAIHELAHLREMNHSPRFWSIVASHCPEWQTYRRQLRELSRQLPQI